ncbi:hypothetical protein FDA09_03795 [Clostridium botulinum]|uniref:hypothetical protein n=1 Tax=Clostridium botulinum TaxID=1491 RepID=UPI00077468CE|nr:hypothetical protein [Clostridium botulinum]NFH79105.1 hypothetical protein [Clostridium botulinum]NFH84734.1 hypothetical protein [Clostridium botulinum]NFI10520.1 hypothetical protein [Clostridium botulinum]NFI14259.1 hypothetical protein [Clostridium botulinum]NFO85740.1 hypothetical protein [Clostridium botulinum]
MSTYSMDITGILGLSEYSNIFDYFSIVDHGDDFIIRINEENKENIKFINSMLEDNKFIISDAGFNSYGCYSISAYKTK